MNPILLLITTLSLLTTRILSYKPQEDIALNCGSTHNVTSDGRNWAADTTTSLYSITGQSQTTSFKTNYSIPPFDTARLSNSNFTYTFTLTPGQKFLRFHFYPSQYQNLLPSESFFSITAGHFKLFSNFSADLASKSYHTQTISKEFSINVGGNDQQILKVTFIPNPNSYAFINGIEIVSMPTSLYYTEDGQQGVTFLGQPNRYPIQNDTVLATVYRVNVGGDAIEPQDDTGMFRYWSKDDDYLTDPDISVKQSNFTIQLEYSKSNYSAPEEVYRTACTMGWNKTKNKESTLTWMFPVDSRLFKYLVRLHFCEFQPEFTTRGDRNFLIKVANLSAEDGFDVINQGEGVKGVPMYRDYVVLFSEVKMKENNLYIELIPNPHDWNTGYNNVILNGVEIFKLNNTDGDVSEQNLDPLEEHLNVPRAKESIGKSHIIPMVVGVVISVAFVVGLALGFFIYRRRNLNGKGRSNWSPLYEPTANSKSTKAKGSTTTLPSDRCRYFSLAEIKLATKNFNEDFIIGVGGFGNVYKGYVDGGSEPIAVKRLKPGSQQGAHEFRTEIEMLSQLRYLHLVSLIGYCNDGEEMILVYDYMSHGTLRDHLYGKDNPALPWKQRLQICVQAAKGLHYLHRGAEHTIIHRDVKTTNILLDDKWVAKVADFGMSKVGPTSLSKAYVSTVVKGSMGYLDPEYVQRQQLTEKSDVYSFGVVLCEVLCARSPLNVRAVDKNKVSLAEWVRICYREDKLDQAVDPSLNGEITNDCLRKFCEIAVSCLADDGSKRPSMNDIIWGLEFALQLQESSMNAHYPIDKDHKMDGDYHEGSAPLLLSNPQSPMLGSMGWIDTSTSDQDSMFTSSGGGGPDSIVSSVSVGTSSNNNVSVGDESQKGMSLFVFSEIMEEKGR